MSPPASVLYCVYPFYLRSVLFLDTFTVLARQDRMTFPLFPSLQISAVHVAQTTLYICSFKYYVIFAYRIVIGLALVCSGHVGMIVRCLQIDCT